VKSSKKQKAEQDERTRQNELTKNTRKVDPARDHLRGDKNALISIILYSDMECPFCKRFAGVPESAAAKFGKVNVVWRHFPLQFHNPSALKEAHASECVSKQAGNNGFFNVANAVLKVSNGNGQGLPEGDAGILALAKQVGVKDAAAFKTCLTAAQTAQAVEEGMKDGTAAGIAGTPGVILRDNVSGRSGIIGGAIPQADVEAQITGLLSESQSN
jgi:protein-disulfide isomerase